MDPKPSYEELFTRNIGFVDETEQAHLRHSRFGVLGVGGMGGVIAQVLVRSGVGALSILDKDDFEPSNNNRQVYATEETWGRPKVDVTAEQLRKINPALDVRVEHHFGGDNIDAVMAGCDVVINGMDELSACVRLWRAAREKKIPLVDAYSAPLPNVFVIRPGDPTPEDFLHYPTVGRNPDEFPVSNKEAAALIDECKLREALHVALHTRSLRYLDMQIINEILTGRRARISFAPMVWGAGLMMAWEAIKLRLGRGKIAPAYGRFWDPWMGDCKDARAFLPFELELIRKAYSLMERA
ncbi:MAG: ThiF family adenylyltransferase [Myxococcaceae bacterium]